MCEQVYFPTGTAKAHTDLVWYERPAVAKAHGHAHKRRLLASAPAMTAEAALRAAEAAELVKVPSIRSVQWQRHREGCTARVGHIRLEALGALLPLSPHVHTPRPSAGSQTQSYTTARLGIRPCSPRPRRQRHRDAGLPPLLYPGRTFGAAALHEHDGV